MLVRLGRSRVFRDNALMRAAPVLFATGVLTVAIGGCGAVAHPPMDTKKADVLASSECSSVAPRSRDARRCVLTLSDGEMLRCALRITGAVDPRRLPAGCTRISRPAPQSSTETLAASIDKARACLNKRGFRASGGPLASSASPGGELVVAAPSGGAFVAYYRGAGEAARQQPSVLTRVARAGGSTDRYGSVVVAWVRQATNAFKAAVRACVGR